MQFLQKCHSRTALMHTLRAKRSERARQSRRNQRLTVPSGPASPDSLALDRAAGCPDILWGVPHLLAGGVLSGALLWQAKPEPSEIKHKHARTGRQATLARLHLRQRPSLGL